VVTAWPRCHVGRCAMHVRGIPRSLVVDFAPQVIPRVIKGLMQKRFYV
jgi:hypothetical protein